MIVRSMRFVVLVLAAPCCSYSESSRGLLSFSSGLCIFSLASVGQNFFSFQWDALLIETTFLAIFLAPTGIRPGREAPSGWGSLFLLHALLFKLMFLSGFVKLASGDQAWADFTALLYHYETQPLPTVFAWYAHQLPSGVQRASVFVMFGVELFVPFLIFATRRCRIVAGCLMAGFQVLILLTGNYCFFNILTIALCALLFDDEFFWL